MTSDGKIECDASMALAADIPSDAAPGTTMDGAWLTVAIFLFLYVISSIDRGVIAMMVGPIEADLHISDFGISLLLGPTFALFYVFCGLPMGWLVDRFSAPVVTFFGVVIWGFFTLSSGLFASAILLATGRMGVGLGEASLTPAAHSKISEMFPKERLATALSVYTLGVVIGSGVAFALGGVVVYFVDRHGAVRLPLLGLVYGWQIVFILIGAATLVFSPLAWAIPHRRRKPVQGASTAGEAGLPDVAFVDYAKRNWWLIVALPIGFGMTNVIVGAFGAWIPTFMIRSYGWNAAQVGVAYGVMLLVCALVGQMGAAVIVDWLYARGVKDAHVKYQMYGLFLSIPCAIFAFFSSSAALFLALIGVFYCVTFPFVGYAAAALQLGAPQHLRARISALLLALVGLVGTAGPSVAGWFTDYLFHDKAQLGSALALVCAIFAPLTFLILAGVARDMRRRATAGLAAS